MFQDQSKSSYSTKSTKTRTRTKKVPFSDIEDIFIKRGISKHGNGQWTRILHDKGFKFHPSRKNSTLAVRATKFL